MLNVGYCNKSVLKDLFCKPGQQVSPGVLPVGGINFSYSNVCNMFLFTDEEKACILCTTGQI